MVYAIECRGVTLSVSTDNPQWAARCLRETYPNPRVGFKTTTICGAYALEVVGEEPAGSTEAIIRLAEAFK